MTGIVKMTNIVPNLLKQEFIVNKISNCSAGSHLWAGRQAQSLGEGLARLGNYIPNFDFEFATCHISNHSDAWYHSCDLQIPVILIRQYKTVGNIPSSN
jgi:hypothetical protein